MRPHWDVLNVSKSKERVKCTSFIRRGFQPPWNLVIVDTIVRSPPDIAATTTQWETIIKAARAADNLGNIFKAVEFHRHERSDAFHAKNEAQKFKETRLWAKQLQLALAGTPSPLSDYVANRMRQLQKPSSPAKPKPAAVIELGGGTDFSFMDRNAQEHYNDYELVKGQGVVRINEHHETERPVIEKPFNLSPRCFATRDETFPISQYAVKGRIVRTAEAATKPIPKDAAIEYASSLDMKWCGSSEWILKISKDDAETVQIPFASIVHTRYIETQLLLITYKGTGADSPNEELLLDFSDAAIDSWRVLKQCCYTVFNDNGYRLDRNRREDQEFFESTLKNLLKDQKKIVRAPLLPQTASRTGPAIKINARRVRNNSLQTRLDIHLKVPSRATPSKPPKFPQAPKSLFRGVSIPKSPQNGVEKGEQHLYYKSSSRSEVQIPVRKGDIVVRRRTKEAWNSGRRDKYDFFDGPWRVKDLGVTQEDFLTKIELAIPQGSKADCWVELRVLLPVLDSSNFFRGEIHAFSLTVAELPQFALLQSRIQPPTRFQTPERDEQAPSFETPTSSIDTPMIDAPDTSIHDPDTLMSNANESEFHLVRAETGIYIAVMEVQPSSITKGNNTEWEVEKLRGKRLRLLSKKHKATSKLTTTVEDNWVQMILKQHPSKVSKDKILVAEYRVHWAGWPDEDDTWELGSDLPPAFLEEYHRITDPYRDAGPDVIVNPDTLIFT